MKYYDLHLIDAFTTNRYGGNIQAHFSTSKKKYNVRIKKVLIKENKFLSKFENYNKFKKNMEISRRKLSDFLEKNSNKIIVGKAYPARASILLHYYNTLPQKLDYIAEQPKSKKINFYAPGTDLKIISSNYMRKNKPDIVVILAWHLFDSIHNKWKNIFKKKVKFVKLLPKFKII